MQGKKVFLAFFITPLFVASLTCARLPAQLTLAEKGESLTADNLAQAAGAVAFASDQLDLGVHFITNLNDGLYGNSHSWIGNGAVPAFVGINLGGSKTISSFAFGRDNQAVPQYNDRYDGTYTLQVTQAAAPDASTPEDQWTTVGTLTYDCAFPDTTRWMRHRYNFAAVEATGIRLLVPATGIAAGTAIDELEVYADPAVVSVDPFLALEATGGPLTTPAAAEDVPTLEEGNLARGAGAVAFGTPPYPDPAHTIAHLNDGLYGNSSSWLGEYPGATSGKFYAGIYFSDGPRKIAQIALGRDNTGQFFDRTAGHYLVQYTQGEFDPADDAATDAAPWITLGLAAEHCRANPWFRRLYSFAPVTARAVRIVTEFGNVLDEIELGEEIGTPPPPPLRLLAAGGPATTPAAAEDVPTLEEGNLARGAGAVSFGTPPYPDPSHTIPHLNDGLYGNSNSWLGNEAGATSGKVYAGVYFSSGPVAIQRIALGRDNTAGFTDRADGAYIVQYTQDEFDPADDAATDGANWSTAGQAADHLMDGTPWLRHVYCLETIRARAVRVIVPLGSVIDELELLAADPPIEYAVLAEVGGSIADGNLATAEGAVAFALDALVDLDPEDPILARHTIPHLNDGVLGNENSWIGRTGDPGFAGIAFGELKTVSSIAFGRDNAAAETDRTFGTYTLQYTTVSAPDASTSDCDWVSITLLEYDAYCPPSAWLRHRFNFTPVEATAIRILVPGTGLANGTCIDEIEVYAEPGAVSQEPCVRPETLALLETGGPVTTPAQAADVPTLEQGNFARAADAVAFGTPPYPAPAHTIPHLNDGLYGNANSWLGIEVGATSGKVYAGIYFTGGTKKIHGIALGRDNLGEFVDRAAGDYLFEITLDEFDHADDAAVDAASWTTLGIATAHLTDGVPYLRHRYGFDPVAVRAVRVRTALENAIDELELLGEPPTNSQPSAVVTTQPDPPTVTLAGGTAQATLDGSASNDGDGGTQGLTYAWEKIGGPEGDSIAEPGEAVTVVTFTQEGEYSYRLTVDDGQATSNTATAEVTITVLPEAKVRFRRGDANLDGKVDISDPIATLGFLFLGSPDRLDCRDAADSDDRGDVNLTDAIYTLNRLFLGGPAIPDPGPESCGPDPTEDSLPDCEYPEEKCS